MVVEPDMYSHFYIESVYRIHKYLDFLVKKFLDPLAAFTQGGLARVWTF